jgi:uncharacterized protein YbjT (DUF2867 family)
MNYVITGSLGHISKPLTEQLVKAGHQVSVISSKASNAAAIEAIGAKALIGSVTDAAFINNSFAGADAVYLMIPPNWNPGADWLVYMKEVADNYVAAVKSNEIKSVVQLSSIGAHLRKGTGPVDGLGYLEEQLSSIPAVNIMFLRPSFFFYNLYAQADLVKNAGIFGANYGGEEKLVLADTEDIAAAAAKALLNLDFKGINIQYISSDERTTDDIAKILGEAIGKPGTPWVLFTDEQSEKGMLDAGLAPTIAENYTAMGKSLREGLMQADYWKNRPVPGKLKLEEFAGRFAAAYNK